MFFLCAPSIAKVRNVQMYRELSRKSIRGGVFETHTHTHTHSPQRDKEKKVNV